MDLTQQIEALDLAGMPAVSEPVRVQYGPREDDNVSLSWAAAMLTELFLTHRNVFGKLLVKASGAGPAGQ